MMIFSSMMKPRALHNNEGLEHSFKCDVCGSKGLGRKYKSEKSREDWGVLPDEWSEVEDKRPSAKKSFVICCSDDCIRIAKDPTTLS